MGAYDHANELKRRARRWKLWWRGAELIVFNLLAIVCTVSAVWLAILRPKAISFWGIVCIMAVCIEGWLIVGFTCRSWYRLWKSQEKDE